MPLIELKNLTIIRKRGAAPNVPFLAIKENILGKNYILTIIFCTPEESRVLNKEYRNKDYTTNILSFPLSKTEGEIYISLSTVKKDAKNFEMSYLKFIHFIIIHGILHLKGLDHGSTMEKMEVKYLDTYYNAGLSSSSQVYEF